MMQRIKKIIHMALLTATTLSLNACYRAKMELPGGASFTYDIWLIQQGKSIIGSTPVININAKSPQSTELFFLVKTGDPANYEMKCFFTDIPAGLTGNFDTINFKFNYKLDLKLDATACPTDDYTVNLNVYSDSFGLQKYPIQLIVRH